MQHRAIERLLEGLAAAAHRLSQEALRFGIEGNGRSHSSIVMRIEYAVKMLRLPRGRSQGVSSATSHTGL